jgi:predicted ATPase/class 3 adenylate cyclase
MKNSPLTFLFTDIEGSRQLWDRYPEAMRTALARHDALLRQSVEMYHGTIYRSIDGACQAVFSAASYAAAAALAAQRSLLGEQWGVIPMRVRMALHSGPAMEKDGIYFGSTVTHLVYLLKAAHAGQILASQAVRSQLENDPQPELRDLGVHCLQDLYSTEACFQLLAPGLPAEFPPLRSVHTYPNNLPVQVTSFIGREKEIAEIGRLLIGTAGANHPSPHSMPPAAACRLVTLVGVGGTGKTRLALQAASFWLDNLPGGAWLVEMGALVDPELVLQMVAKELGVCHQSRQNLLGALIDYLRSRQTLLVLDQCEHLLEACTQFVDTLLRTCPNLKILATCREALKIPGEMVFHMPPLSLPDSASMQHEGPTLAEYAQSDAVSLFIERAGSVQPDFLLTEQNAPHVAQICQRLDGLPLAIELAAMRVNTLPVEGISARIENRFRLLTGSPRTALSHPQSIRAIIDWSYDLLSPSERTLLGRLAVFAGGWTLEAVTAICTDDQQMAQYLERRSGIDRRLSTSPWNGLERRSGIDRRSLTDVLIPAASIVGLLTHLVEKGLVTTGTSYGQKRYRMVGTLRQYSREKLLGSGEAERMHSQHLSYFANLAVEADLKLWTAEQAAWFKQIEAEIDNFRTALEWAEASPDMAEVESGLQLAGSLWQYWITLGCWSEGKDRLERLFARIDVAGHAAEGARALNLAGILAARSGNFPEARQYLEHAQSIGSELGDPFKIAHSLYGLGLAAFLEGDLNAAHQQYEASLTLYRSLDYKAGISVALRDLGELALRKNDLEKSRQCFEESLAICQQMGHKLGAAEAYNALGSITKRYGDLTAAQQNFQEALTLLREINHLPGIADALMGLGSIARSTSGVARTTNEAVSANIDFAAARTYLEESLAIYRKLGNKKRVAFTLTRLDEITRTLGDYTAARSFYEESLVVLGELNPSGGIITALNDLGDTSLQEGDPHQAASFFQEALTLGLETGDKPGIASNLVGLASVFLQLGKTDRWRWAVRLLGQAEIVLETSGVNTGVDNQTQIEAIYSELRKKLGDGLFDSAREEGQDMSLGQVISYALEKIPVG